MKLTSIPALILVICSTLSVCNTTHKDQLNEEDYSSSECQHRKLDRGERCDVTTNCKYSGKCRKVADIQRDGTSVRFVVPLVELPDVNSTELSQEIAPSILVQMIGQGYSWGPEECVCDFTCGEGITSLTGMHLCASNGRTYKTECHMKRDACLCQSNIVLSHEGPCETSGNAGQIAEVKNQLVQIYTVGDCAGGCKYGATCDEETGKCICNVECAAQPIVHFCGKDGRTYTNLCHVKRAQCRYQKGIDILRRGSCHNAERHGATTHSNGKRRGGNCNRLDCNASVEEPVCGTDDVSYPNECVLKQASCVKGYRIKVKHTHFCGQRNIEESISPKPSPVRTSKGLEDGRCDGISCHFGGICIEHEKYHFICSCDAICNEVAPVIEEQNTPTVGAEIITPGTEPGIKFAWAEQREDNMYGGRRKRKRKHRTSRKRRTRRRGRSRRSIEGPRDLIYEVLCGTDNMTYTNECQMKKHACHEKMKIAIAHRGACVRPVISQANHISPTTQKSMQGEPVEMRDGTIDANLFQSEDERQVATTIDTKSNSPEGKNNRHALFDLTGHTKTSDQEELGPTESDLSLEIDHVPGFGEKETPTTRTFEMSTKFSSQYENTSRGNMEKALQADKEFVKFSPSESSTPKDRIIFTSDDTKAPNNLRNATIASTEIVDLFAKNETNNSNPQVSSENGGGVVVLVLGIAFGQFLVFAALVAIFLFLRNRKKLKKFHKGKKTSITKCFDEKGQNENEKKQLSKISGE